jgi:hypothetical protein
MYIRIYITILNNIYTMDLSILFMCMIYKLQVLI